MDTAQTTAIAAVAIVLTLAVTTVIIIRIVVRDSTAAERPRILSSTAGLIRAILGMK
ncbi:MAG: hypothetical protein ACRDVE_03890 [Actinocrinis sp.]